MVERHCRWDETGPSEACHALMLEIVVTAWSWEVAEADAKVTKVK